jgi:hypothetical protein
MRSIRQRVGVIAGIAVLALALLVTVALPQTASAHGGPWGRDGWGGPGVGWFDQGTYLADALGITVAELRTAQQKAYETALDRAVAQGLITQAQADYLKQRGTWFGFGKMMSPWFLGSSTIDMEALLADALGITVAELRTAQAKALDAALADAVKAGYLTQAQADQLKAQWNLNRYLNEQGLAAKMRSLYEEAVKAAVAAGIITQEQADQILQNQTWRLPGFGWGLHGFGGRGFHGRGGFPFFFSPGTGTGTVTPSRFGL